MRPNNFSSPEFSLEPSASGVRPKTFREFKLRSRKEIDDKLYAQRRAKLWESHDRSALQIPDDSRFGDTVIPTTGQTTPILNAAEFTTEALTDDELTAAVASRFISIKDLSATERTRVGDIDHIRDNPRPGFYRFIGKLSAQLDSKNIG